jgi:two-component system LytT family response regulator
MVVTPFARYRRGAERFAQGQIACVIFVTAHDQHALRAFSIHALDYLLKPIDDSRFATAVDRAAELMKSTARTQMAERILQMLNREPGKYPSRILVRTGQRTQIVELRSADNREHVITLSDGSEHRSSRTYAPGLEQWLGSVRPGR